jgi:hypothetical protein
MEMMTPLGIAVALWVTLALMAAETREWYAASPPVATCRGTACHKQVTDVPAAASMAYVFKTRAECAGGAYNPGPMHAGWLLSMRDDHCLWGSNASGVADVTRNA